MTVSERRALVEAHLPMLRAIAADTFRRYPRCDFGDLMGAGAVGLCLAARRYSPARGVTFAGFAWPRVKGAMVDWMRKAGRYSRGQVARLRGGADVSFVGLDAIAELPANDPPPDEQIAAEEVLTRARSRIEGMDPRMRRLMDLIYENDLDGKAAGDALGITKTWVCQLRQRAIRELQEAA